MFKVGDRVYDIHDPAWEGTVVGIESVVLSEVKVQWDNQRGTEDMFEEDLEGIA